MNEFYLFFYRYKYKDLILAELNLKYPEMKLSFSNREFLSMKGPAHVKHKLKDEPIIFSLRQGIFLGKSGEDQGGNSLKVGEQFWQYELIKSEVDLYKYVEKDISADVPARAYHKMEQAHSLFKLDIESGDYAIEMGSAPGGISYYLLHLGIKLCSIDPADMNENLFKNFPEHFKHIKKSIFDVERYEFPKKCDWLISDLNLPGDFNINQAKRIMDYYPNIKGVFLTIKVPNISELKKISKWLEIFKSFEVNAVHLPAHRREFGLIIKNNKGN
jgi:hypothetical protein